MKNIFILALAVALAYCTAATTFTDSEITEDEIVARMDRVGSTFAWYCGSEGVSFRSIVRVGAYLVMKVAKLGGEVPDACAGYNAARAEAVKMIEAEKTVLESGLLDQQSTTQETEQ